jgi:hypothetical protein
MNANLNKIAQDLYGKIQTRFKDIKMGDENAEVLSKKADIPEARFFEFDYMENGESLGTIAITLDEDDGVVVQISGDLAERQHPGAFKFIRSFRQFAKDRLLNFDIQNIGKSNLDKRDYHFQAKPKEEVPMEPIMESSMYGTSRISYQDLGEARLVVKHSQNVNPEVAAGRTMHIEAIYVENAQGERFKYPYKHLNGARALAEHLKHGGNPYDAIGKHISSLSEELAQLRKFKGYVSRNGALSEAMEDITPKVFERIEAVKKEVQMLQRPAYYEQFAESFEDREEQMIPEDVMTDWIDRLTIRTFNEELRTAFPYIFRLVDESSIPIKELSPDDLLDESSEDDNDENNYYYAVRHNDKRSKETEMPPKGWTSVSKHATHGEAKSALDTLKAKHRGEEFTTTRHPRISNMGGVPKKVFPENELDEVFDGDKEEGTTHKGGKVTKKDGVTRHEKTDYDDGEGQRGRKVSDAGHKNPKYKYPVPDPEEQFESFLDSILEDMGSVEGKNALFSKDIKKRSDAAQKLKALIAGGLTPGINATVTLKGIIDCPSFDEEIKKLSDTDDIGTAVKIWLDDIATGKIDEPALHDPASGLEDNIQQVAQELLATKVLDGQPGSTPVGGKDMNTPPLSAEPPASPAPEVPPVEAPPTQPPVGATSTAPVSEEVAPWYKDQAEQDADQKSSEFKKKNNPNRTGRDTAKALAHKGIEKALHKAKQAGATLETQLDFGYKVMTVGEAIGECGMKPAQFGYQEQQNPIHEILKSIAGFWNAGERNLTSGGTKAKIHILKNFKAGNFDECGAQPAHIKQVFGMIEKLDPSTTTAMYEEQRIRQLAGLSHTLLSDDEQYELTELLKVLKD